jgi:copper(I)-binding protein
MNMTVHRWVTASLILLLAGCGGGTGSSAPEIRVDGAWVRAMPLISGQGEATTNSAAYLLIANDGGGGDRLTAATSEVAERVEIHESKVVNDLMVMEELDGLEIPPHGSVELKPGGIHIMLLGIKRPLLEGEEIQFFLHFEKVGDLSIRVPVRSNAGH